MAVNIPLTVESNWDPCHFVAELRLRHHELVEDSLDIFPHQTLVHETQESSSALKKIL